MPISRCKHAALVASPLADMKYKHVQPIIDQMKKSLPNASFCAVCRPWCAAQH
jgi:hypothetical protein